MEEFLVMFNILLQSDKFAIIQTGMNTGIT